MSQATRPRRVLRLAAASVGVIALGGLGLSALTAAPQPDPLGEKTGGDTTVYATGRNAFSFPAANLPDDERTRFVIGNSFFRRNWVEAPASTKARDGLGPHFIARSCGGCHVQDGRGEPPAIFNRLGETRDPTVALLIRLSIPGTDAHGGPRHEPTYGDQFNNIVLRTADRPEGTWSAATVLMPQQNGGIYAPMMQPWSPSTLGTGTDLYWNLSLWSEYNVMLMKTDLTKL